MGSGHGERKDAAPGLGESRDKTSSLLALPWQGTGRTVSRREATVGHRNGSTGHPNGPGDGTVVSIEEQRHMEQGDQTRVGGDMARMSQVRYTRWEW